jgi:hypothetical protein
MIKSLRAFFDFRFPWNHEKVRSRLRPLRLRVAEENDFAYCEKLHVDNEPFGVPSNHRAVHAAALRAGDMLTLIAEEGGVPVGCCGLQLQPAGIAWFCYALVEPIHHRTGIGTTMFVACLSLLPTGLGDQKIGISALETSLPFYRRLGFRLVGRFDHDDGNRYPIAVLEPIPSRLIEDCRAMLRSAGVTVLAETHQIPKVKEPQKTAAPAQL